MLRLGLCCKFAREPIKFRTTTARYAGGLPTGRRQAYLSELCLTNAQALAQALAYCRANGIGCFRVNSQILPLKTHPRLGYDVRDLPAGREIIAAFQVCGRDASRNGLRLSLHPDQFVLLSSPDPEVTRKSIDELEYQAEVAEWTGADVINIHGGGGYGDPDAALRRLAGALKGLSRRLRRRLTLENDDRVYTPAMLLPFCEAQRIPFVYDVHHHRCLPDGLSVEQATARALATWDREPLFHLSSPREGWTSASPQYHHDDINPRDFPDCWRDLDITVEIEAKAKELAIQRLRPALAAPLWPG